MEMGAMSILVGQEQGNVLVTVLKIEGDIDAGTYKDLQDKASELIAAGTSNILLDLGQVEYMGSAGFRAIHAIANMLNKEQKEGMYKSEHVKLLNPQDEVARVIKTLGFDSFLEIHKDKNGAIASF
jgi:anti-sigma B factor antagonist